MTLMLRKDHFPLTSATRQADASVMEIQICKIIGQEGPAILLELFLTIQRLITGTENRPG